MEVVAFYLKERDRNYKTKYGTVSAHSSLTSNKYPEQERTTLLYATAGDYQVGASVRSAFDIFGRFSVRDCAITK